MRLHRIFGAGVRLSAVEGERRPIWIQAAVTGTWKGHPAHPVIEFTEKTFDEVIANFRKNPSFKLGADGKGAQPVIRCDYEHASEVGDPTKGNIPTQGVSAPGWVFDLEKRRGADGKVQLWALVEMGERLWEQVSNKEYLWTSVAINPSGRDRVSGAPIGHVMTSLAMTNDPFILGMEPMTTSMERALHRSEKIAACAQVLVNDSERSVVVHQAPAIDDVLAPYHGFNRHEKAISLLTHKIPGFSLRSWGEQVSMARDFLAGRIEV